MRVGTFLMPEGFYISASRINLYNQCEKCFYLKYVLWVPAPVDDSTPYNYGNAVHNTVDAISQWKNLEVSKEQFNSPEDYDAYLWHRALIEREFAQTEWMPQYFVPEVEFVREIAGVPVYWFLDWVVFDDYFARELETRDFIPRAVEIKDSKLTKSWKILNRHWTDSKWEHRIITSDLGKFGESNILRVVEMKTQANKRSYNAIKTNYQFMLYGMVNDEFFGGKLFQLINFYRKPFPWIQKERIVIDDKQCRLLTNKIVEIYDKYKNGTFSNVSTCWHFSPYREICQNFTI